MKYVAILFLLISTGAHSQSSCLLDQQWNTPSPTPLTYGYGGGWISGVQDPANSVLPTDPKALFERNISPDPGTIAVERVRIGLKSLNDVNDNMTVRAVLYDDDGAGGPGVLIAESASFSPTGLGVPIGSDPNTDPYQEFWFDFPVNSIPSTSSFHAGIIITPGDVSDVLVVPTSCLGPSGCPVAEGEADGSNHIWTTGFGYENLFSVYGANFDLNIVPKLKGPDLSFSYDKPIYFTDETDPSPTISGIPGGTFTSKPVGLVIDSISGEIDLSASTLGDYTVVYTGSTPTTCIDSSNQVVSIQATTPVELLKFSID